MTYHVRMYSYVEARLWTTKNLLWFEEAADLLQDAYHDLLTAAAALDTDLPAPSDYFFLPDSVLFLMDKSKAPKPIDKAAVVRVRRIGYLLDNAAYRTSSSFHKTVGLLAAYFGIDVGRTGQLSRTGPLFKRLATEFPDDPDLRAMLEILDNEAFRAGQGYRNPRVHSLSSFSLYTLAGRQKEIDETVVIYPGVVGVKPRPTSAAPEWVAMMSAFYGAGANFFKHGVQFMFAHPPYSAASPFQARVIQMPMLYRTSRPDLDPGEYTSSFTTNDTVIHAVVLVAGGLGHRLRFRFVLPGQKPYEEEGTVSTNDDQKLRMHAAPPEGRAFAVGEGRFEAELDGQRVWRVPFRIEAATAATQEEPVDPPTS